MVGQVFVFHGFRFEILERHRNQITRLKITPITEEKSETGEASADRGVHAAPSLEV